MEPEELELFARTLRQVVEDHGGAALDAELAGVGWHDALADDPRSAVGVLFDCLGAANAASSALDDVVGDALGAAYGARAAVVLPAPGRTAAPGALDGGHLVVRGIGTARLAEADTALVVADQEGGERAVTVKTAGLALQPVGGVDRALGLVAVRGPCRDAVSAADLPPGTWAAAVARGQLALAHELVGAAGSMLGLARGHALERVQFGRPIASFQAVRHRLAETLVAVEAARAGLEAAWEDGSPVAATMAKALAGRGARTAARHCQQVLAGIGFTAEHPFHRYFRRVVVLDELLGSTRALTRSLGADLLARRQLPAAPPL